VKKRFCGGRRIPVPVKVLRVVNIARVVHRPPTGIVAIAAPPSGILLVALPPTGIMSVVGSPEDVHSDGESDGGDAVKPECGQEQNFARRQKGLNPCLPSKKGNTHQVRKVGPEPGTWDGACIPN